MGLACSDLCLNFSCGQELTSEAHIVNMRFTKSVISSKAAFTYEEAQIRKDDPLVLRPKTHIDPFDI